MLENPRIEQIPTRTPATCRGCGAASTSGREWFLDTDCDDDDQPGYAIIFCKLCFETLAEVAGFIQVGEQIQQYKNRISELEGTLDEYSIYRDLADLLGIDPVRLGRLLALGQTGSDEVSSNFVEPGTTERSGEEPITFSVDSGAEQLPGSTDDKDVGTVRTTKRSKSSI